MGPSQHDTAVKSTSGEHFVALDHVRAIAALLVFSWHFIHGRNGFPIPFEGAPFWAFAFFDEGHVGVALFMTLSGYLFAKLLDGKSIVYHKFIWNRILRLMPLLLLVLFINAAMKAVQSNDIRSAYWYLRSMLAGLIFPVWPNGGWSITVELHFYLLLPILIFAVRRSSRNTWLLVALAVGFRASFYAWAATVQDLAYHTIFGRFDQFLLGISAFYGRKSLVGRHTLVACILVAFASFYWWFDAIGGYHLPTQYPGLSAIWIVLPTLEGLAFAATIAWYDGSFVHQTGPASNMLAKIGEYSYSIYLLHFFFVFDVALWLNTYVTDLSNFYKAWLVSLVAFVGMLPLGYLSMRFVERPFLKLRQPYLRK